MKTFRERFDEKWELEPNSGCWLWSGALKDNAYGWMRNESGVHTRAHRLAWGIYRGLIPDGMGVLHTCDVVACVNPEHLFLGSQQDNVADMMAKGRHRHGSDRSVGNLSESDFWSIREARGILTQGELAELFGIDRTVISRIQLHDTRRVASPVGYSTRPQ